MRRTIFVDIETLPAVNPAVTDLQAVHSAPTAIAPPEHRPDPLKDEAQLKTSLNGDFGRILCIGYVDVTVRGEIERGVIGWDTDLKTFHCNERMILTEFWQRMRAFRPNIDRIVGHNIFDFDLKFILKRSIIHGVRPTVDLSFARYRNQPIFDTMCEWERWSYGPKASLDTLAKALGLESSKQEGVNGSQIYNLFQAGEHRKIRDYCLKDVELTRAIYKRMVFEDCAIQTTAARMPTSARSELVMMR
ncbi:MAG: ribonuclease H-like domain-containing protein [Burkholderiales bacterium]